MKSLFLAALTAGLTLTSSALFANECKTLWIARNTIFYNNGYCFGSSLGQGYFGNAGCHTKNPSLSASEKSRIGTIKAREKRLNCASQKKHWTVSSLRAGAAPSAPSSSGTYRAPAPAPASYSFQCRVPCSVASSGSGIVANDKLREVTITVTSSSRSQAQSYARDNQSRICKSAGLYSIPQYAFCN